MGSKLRQMQDAKKATFAKQLEARRALLVSRGIEQRRIDKDTIVRRLKAGIDAVNIRLKAIDASEKKTAELAAAKAAKAAAKVQEKTPAKGEKAAEAPKEKKEKKEKKPKETKEGAAPAEAKEKKPKKEKAEKAEKPAPAE